MSITVKTCLTSAVHVFGCGSGDVFFRPETRKVQSGLD
jgi:hypothetical protein